MTSLNHPNGPAGASAEGPQSQPPPGGGSRQVVPHPRSALHGFLAGAREVALVLVIAMALSLVIKTFFVQAFYIPSGSMENTLLVGDRVLVNKLSPGPLSLRRGDIVVFKDPGHWLTEQTQPKDGPVKHAVRDVLTFIGLLPSDSGEHLIKRVIGLPGDTVARGEDGRITVNGVAIDEPYLYPGDEPSTEPFTATVPQGRIWVMGDHRGVSQDSRFHRDIDGGTVPIKNVVGVAFVIVWPVSRWGLLPNPEAVFKNVPSP